MRKVKFFSLFFVLLLIATLTSCVNPKSPERVVILMYKSISENDENAYIETMLPENRFLPNIFGLMSAVSLISDIVEVDISRFTKISIKNLQVKVIKKYKNYALVQAEGKIRYPLLALELQFCDQHDVRYLEEDGNWYVDMYAPERIARLEKILAIKQQELQAMVNNPSFDAGFWGSYIASLKNILNLCN